MSTTRGRLAILLTALVAVAYGSARAQNLHDITLYSQENPAITSRGLAMGNAMGAVGADFTSVTSNPAALGAYRRTDLSMSIGMGANIRDASHLGVQSSIPNGFVGFNQFGLTLGLIRPSGDTEGEGIQTINFALTYGRMNDFTSKISVLAHNPHETYADYLAQWANRLGLTSDQLNPISAYDIYPPQIVTAWGARIVDEHVVDGSKNPKIVRIVSPYYGSETALQHFAIRQRGHISEWGISAAINYSHRLFVGATIGIPVLTRTLDRVYQEENDTPIPVGPFRKYTQTHGLKEEGVGVNAKIGALYRPADFLRIGLALHTPSLLVLRYKESFRAESHFANREIERAESPLYTGQYALQTPLRARASAAIIFGKLAMIAADYSYDLYPMTRILQLDTQHTVDDSHTPDLRGAHVLNLGAEILFGPIALRAGVGGATSPYKPEAPLYHTATRMQASGGVGFSGQFFYLDLAYRRMTDRGAHHLYDFQLEDGSMVTRTVPFNQFHHQLLATLGLRF